MKSDERSSKGGRRAAERDEGRGELVMSLTPEKTEREAERRKKQRWWRGNLGS